MKKLLVILLIAFVAGAGFSASATKSKGTITKRDVNISSVGKKCAVSLKIDLTGLDIRNNDQFYVTPVISDGDASVVMPSVLVSGRSMHYVYMRNGNKPLRPTDYKIKEEVWRRNGTVQVIDYTDAVPMEPWMRRSSAKLYLAIDTCGCGMLQGKGMGIDPTPLDLDVARHMRLAYRQPITSEPPITAHEGKARVQFEVNHIELHEEVYKCKSGQVIDNRAQLKVIDDSVHYALTDKNVEIASINICGFASPESPYSHNEYLATNRSRALAEYVSRKYHLPQDRCNYDAVVENWEEFREIVVAATDISEKQRTALLELIDRPTHGPADFDDKETELKTSPVFAELYRTKILPDWFPQLRCTKFTINTRLKPLPDEDLCKVIKTTPQLLSLNQIYRVAKCYAEGSEEFHYAMAMALKYYPDEEVANLNGAVLAINDGNLTRAAELLAKAGNSPEAENARGVLCVNNDDLEAAARHFDNAGNLPEAIKNKSFLK